MKKEIYLWLGIVFLLAGIILSFKLFLHFTFIFVLGQWSIFHYLNLRQNKEIKFNFIRLFIISAAITLIIELFVRHSSSVWVYNFDFFNFSYDFWPSMAAWMLYFPASLEICNFFDKSEIKVKKYSINNFVLLVSIILLVISFFKILDSRVHFAMLVFGIFCITDYISFKLNKKSVLSDLLNKNFSIIPIWLIISISIEVLNIIYDYVWRYYPPFLDFEICKIPLVVIFGWIPLAGIYINSARIAKNN